MRIGMLIALLPAALIAGNALASDGADVRKTIESDQARTAAIEARLRTVEMERALLEAERRLEEMRGDAVTFPVLVGIVTQGGSAVAEFADAAGVRTVRVGAPVLPGWSLSAIEEGAVSVRSAAGATRRIRLGTRGAQK